jgi:hypothetical protein
MPRRRLDHAEPDPPCPGIRIRFRRSPENIPIGLPGRSPA